jgi:PPP family 3-phenylpropionic acid transporter
VLPIALFLFVLFAGRGSFRPYVELFLREKGFTGSQIGLIVGIGWALSVFAPPLYGALADRTQRSRLLLASTNVCLAAVVLALAVSSSLGLLFALAVAFKLLWAAGEPLIASTILGEAERLGTDYGRLRLWTSAGAGIALLGAGFFVRRFGTGAVFFSFATLAIVSLLPLRWVPEAKPRREVLRARLATTLLRARSTQVVMLIAFLWSVTSAGYYGFYTIYLADLGADPVLIGIAWAISLAGDVTVLRASGWFVRRHGVRALLVAGLAGSAVRWAAFTLAPGAGFTLPFQLLHGLTFGATTTAAVLLVDAACPPALRATGQGLLTLVMNGLGGLVGSVAAGAAYQVYGPRWLFGASAAGVAITGVLAYVLLGAVGVRGACPAGVAQRVEAHG